MTNLHEVAEKVINKYFPEYIGSDVYLGVESLLREVVEEAQATVLEQNEALVEVRLSAARAEAFEQAANLVLFHSYPEFLPLGMREEFAKEIRAMGKV